MTPGWHEMLRVFGRIGLLSFGGPAAQIALMHKELVEDRSWLSEQQYLRALSFCMLLPGPEAMQLATYAGWRQRGIPGGLLAGGLFVMPGALVILTLALAYGAYGDLPALQAAFVGVQATVIIIVIAALRKVMSKALHGPIAYLIAAASFVALFAFAVPFPLVILFAAAVGAALLAKPDVEQTADLDTRGTFWIIIIGLAIWAAPVLLALALDAAFLAELGLFFSKLAVVTFGGAYAVLAYMTQTVVVDYHWITTTQMMDALGLAETTPGPLILVTQFVGMLAGLAHGGIGIALLAGLLTLWVTFVPCFIWIFAGAPLIDWLAGQARMQAALAGITAAVVGVIANLSLWFAFHVFFAKVGSTSWGPLTFVCPDINTLQWQPVVLAAIAFGLMIWRKIGLLTALFITAACALVFHVAGLL